MQQLVNSATTTRSLLSAKTNHSNKNNAKQTSASSSVSSPSSQSAETKSPTNSSSSGQNANVSNSNAGANSEEPSPPTLGNNYSPPSAGMSLSTSPPTSSPTGGSESEGGGGVKRDHHQQAVAAPNNQRPSPAGESFSISSILNSRGNNNRKFNNNHVRTTTGNNSTNPVFNPQQTNPQYQNYLQQQYQLQQQRYLVQQQQQMFNLLHQQQSLQPPLHHHNNHHQDAAAFYNHHYYNTLRPPPPIIPPQPHVPLLIPPAGHPYLHQTAFVPHPVNFVHHSPHAAGFLHPQNDMIRLFFEANMWLANQGAFFPKTGYPQKSKHHNQRKHQKKAPAAFKSQQKQQTGGPTLAASPSRVNDFQLLEAKFLQPPLHCSTTTSPSTTPSTEGLVFFENQKRILQEAMMGASDNTEKADSGNKQSKASEMPISKDGGENERVTKHSNNKDEDIDDAVFGESLASTKTTTNQSCQSSVPNRSSKQRHNVAHRSVFTDKQRTWLERAFELGMYIGRSDRKKLAEGLGMSETQVKIWFQNRRMKWRHVQPSSEAAESPTSSTKPGSSSKCGSRTVNRSDMETAAGVAVDDMGKQSYKAESPPPITPSDLCK